MVVVVIFVILPLLCVGAGATVCWTSVARRRRLDRADSLCGQETVDVAFTGRAEPHDAPLVAPSSNRPCVWFEVEVEVRTGIMKYERVKSAQSGVPFLLVADDGTRAQVEVNRLWLANSNVTQLKTKTKGVPQQIMSGSSARTHRVTESILPTGVVVTVLSQLKKTEQGYRALAATSGHPVFPDALLLGGEKETLVAVGDRATLGMALVKHLLVGVLLLGIGVAWGGASVWYFATP